MYIPKYTYIFRCIGVFHDQHSSVCMLINATEKKEVCDNLNWSTWRAYKKQIGISFPFSAVSVFSFDVKEKLGLSKEYLDVAIM